MTLTIPVFDVDALRQWAEIRDRPPADPERLLVLWRHLIDDLQAAADQLELLEHARRTAA